MPEINQQKVIAKFGCGIVHRLPTTFASEIHDEAKFEVRLVGFKLVSFDELSKNLM